MNQNNLQRILAKLLHPFNDKSTMKISLLIILLSLLSSCTTKQYTDAQCLEARPLLRSAWDVVRFNRHCEKYKLQGEKTWKRYTIESTTNGKTTRKKVVVK